MAAGEIEVLLEVGGFDVEMTMIQVHINIQKHDLGGGGMPGEFDRTAAIETFDELGEGGGTMRQEEEDVINKKQQETGLLNSRMK